MKAVLISIRPKWCEMIASGKKTIEVRKKLSEFKRWEEWGTDLRPCQNGKPCEHEVFDYGEDCMVCGIDFDGTDCPFYKVARPPQSWCYVESLEGGTDNA